MVSYIQLLEEEKERLEQSLEVGKDILDFVEINSIKKKIKHIDRKIKNIKKSKGE